MGKKDHFRIAFSEDKAFAVEFSDEFLSSSVDGQMDMLKALLREKLAVPFSGEDVSLGAAENEIAIVLIETFLAKLRRGERIEKDTKIDMSLQDLETPFNTWD